MRADHTVAIAAPLAQVLAVITEFEQYPEFLPAVRHARVVGQEGAAWEVSFSVQLARRLDFTLRILQHVPAPDGTVRLSWSLVQGALMACDGGWTLRPREDGGTDATWETEVLVQAFVPQVLVNTLRRWDLPELLEAFRRRAEPAAAPEPPATPPGSSAPPPEGSAPAGG